MAVPHRPRSSLILVVLWPAARPRARSVGLRKAETKVPAKVGAGKPEDFSVFFDLILVNLRARPFGVGMTHLVLQADIELAKRLIAAGCQESGIVASLCWRGVGREEAITLVRRLRQGCWIDPAACESSADHPIQIPRARGSRHRHRGMRPTSLRHHVHHHRTSWRRAFRKAVRWSGATAAACLVFWSFVILALGLYDGALQIARDRSNRNPSWQLNLSRWQQGRKPPVADLGPSPSSSSSHGGSSVLTGSGLPLGLPVAPVEKGSSKLPPQIQSPLSPRSP